MTKGRSLPLFFQSTLWSISEFIFWMRIISIVFESLFQSWLDMQQPQDVAVIWLHEMGQFQSRTDQDNLLLSLGVSAKDGWGSLHTQGWEWGIPGLRNEEPGPVWDLPWSSKETWIWDSQLASLQVDGKFTLKISVWKTSKTLQEWSINSDCDSACFILGCNPFTTKQSHHFVWASAFLHEHTKPADTTLFYYVFDMFIKSWPSTFDQIWTCSIAGSLQWSSKT